ncbi:MAG: hypothetical protein ACJAXX_002673 [Roseivirga sp.]|jgi:hypothetical protein
MAITRLKRKARRNKQRSAGRVLKIKQLTQTPVLVNVDKEELKASFAPVAQTEEAPKAEQVEAKTEEAPKAKKVKAETEEAPKAEKVDADTEEAPKAKKAKAAKEITETAAEDEAPKTEESEG